MSVTTRDDALIQTAMTLNGMSRNPSNTEISSAARDLLALLWVGQVFVVQFTDEDDVLVSIDSLWYDAGRAAERAKTLNRGDQAAENPDPWSVKRWEIRE